MTMVAPVLPIRNTIASSADNDGNMNFSLFTYANISSKYVNNTTSDKYDGSLIVILDYGLETGKRRSEIQVFVLLKM
jgi:hypothetical protein